MKTALKISQEEKKRHNNDQYANKKHKQNQHSQNKKQAKETNKGKKGNKKNKNKNHPTINCGARNCDSGL